MAKQSMARVKLEADELSRLAKENGLSWHQIKAAIGPIAPAS
jgi:hypothetical protein